MSERLLKYFEDYIKSRVSIIFSLSLIMYVKDNLMEKLHLKNSTMKVKRKKLMIQLKQVRYCIISCSLLVTEFLERREW